MSDELWFRLFPSKFMAGIRGLNANEVKVYISLLCRMYERGGPLKNDAEILSTYCEMRPSSFEVSLARLVRLEKIILTADGMLFNDAAKHEISRRESYSENAKRAGKKSAEKRQLNQHSEATDVQPTPNHIREEEDKDKDTPIVPKGTAQAQLFPEPEKPVKTPKRKAVFPEDWKLDPSLREWARSKGFTDAKIDAMRDACVDFHRGKGNVFLDFNAGFRTWASNELTRNPPSSQQPANGPRFDPQTASILAQLAAKNGRRA